jgi:hypothetical protein
MAGHTHPWLLQLAQACQGGAGGCSNSNTATSEAREHWVPQHRPPLQIQRARSRRPKLASMHHVAREGDGALNNESGSTPAPEGRIAPWYRYRCSACAGCLPNREGQREAMGQEGGNDDLRVWGSIFPGHAMAQQALQCRCPPHHTRRKAMTKKCHPGRDVSAQARQFRPNPPPPPPPRIV